MDTAHAPETADALASLATALTAARIRMYAGQADVEALQTAISAVQNSNGGPKYSGIALPEMTRLGAHIPKSDTLPLGDDEDDEDAGSEPNWGPSPNATSNHQKCMALATLWFDEGELFTYADLFDVVVEQGWDRGRARSGFTGCCAELRTRIDEQTGKKVAAELPRWNLIERVTHTSPPRHRRLPGAVKILHERGIIVWKD